MTDSQNGLAPLEIELPKETIDKFKVSLEQIKVELSAVEKITGSLITDAHKNKNQPLLKFCHDVFQTLFPFPAFLHTLKSYVEAWEKDMDSSGESKVVANYNRVMTFSEFIWRFGLRVKFPRDKTIRGNFYPAKWNRQENIPCLIRILTSSEEYSESKFSSRMEEITERVSHHGIPCRVIP